MDSVSAVKPRDVRTVRVWDREADVVVVGLGSAGACAGIEAASTGASTLVLEAAWRGGGTTAESTAQIYMGGGTPLQQACGFDDTPDEMFRYLMASCGPEADEAKVRLFSDESVAHYRWLTDRGVPFEQGFVPYEASTMPMPGASLSYTGSERAYPYREIARPAPRGHTVQRDGVGSGEYLMQILVEQFERSGGEIQPNTRSETLVVDSEGRVVGVVARVGSDPCLIRARRGVILTTGGFIQNPEMLRWYAPEVLRCGRPIAAETSDDGSGIRMGIGAGGAAVRMDSACIVLGFAYGNRDNIRGILVNAQGQRYVNEDVYQSNHGEIALKRQQGEVYLIVDDSIYQAPSDDPSLAGVLYPLLAAGETPSELESELGMPLGSLQHTLEVYNENAAKGEDPYFKKESCWVRPLEPPYAALDLRVGNSPYSVFTLGGLHTRVGGEVLDAEGAVVPGLYAAGRTASGIPAQGYNSGLSIADCTFTGRLAGASAAAASVD